MGLIANAQLDVIHYNSVVQTGLTDANGEIQFKLPIGTYFVKVSKTGYVTHTYMLELLEQAETIVLNLPIEPFWMFGLGIAETMSISASAKKGAGITETISEGISVTSTPSPLPTQSLSLNPTVTKTPTTWRLNVLPPVCTDGNQPIPADAISPVVGPVDSGNGVTVPTIATTKQFLLYWYSYLDGTLVNDNGANSYEAVATTHSYTVPAQTLGSLHRYVSMFKAAWEAVVSVDGPGTTNKTGTYEIVDGQSLAITATPNALHIFLYWEVDGEIVSTNASYTFSAQQRGMSHNLVAHFF